MSQTTSTSSASDPPVGVERRTRAVALLARQEACGERLAPVLDPLDGAVETMRGGRDGDLLAPHDALLPEPAAHVRHGHAHRPFRDPQRAREHRADLVGHLRAGLHEQLVVPVVPRRDDAPRLQRERVLPAAAGGDVDGEGGVRERLVHPRGVEHRDVEQDVVGGLVVHGGCTGGERRLLRDDGVERVVGDQGGLDAVLHGVRVAGDDERQRLADEAHLAAGEDRHRGGRELLGGPVEDGDDVAERQVRGVVGRDDAVDLAGRGEVQLRDRGVRDRGCARSRACSIPDSAMSSMKRPRPVSRRGSSCRGIDAPTQRPRRPSKWGAAAGRSPRSGWSGSTSGGTPGRSVVVIGGLPRPGRRRRRRACG